MYPEDTFLRNVGIAISAMGGTVSLALLYFRIQTGAYIAAWYAAVGIFSALAACPSKKRVLLMVVAASGLLANVGFILQSLMAFNVPAMNKTDRLLAAIFLPIGYLTTLTVPIMALSDRLKVLWRHDEYSNI